MITIGIVFRGPELRGSEADKVLSAALAAAMEARAAFEFARIPAVNVVFHVPGSLGGPDWEGLRNGKFSRREKMLMVQVAVPEEIAASDKLLAFVIDALHGANAIAFHVFDEKGMAYPLREAEELVNKIAELTAAKLA